jgi:AcrR family transcriptional regulator
MAVARTPRNSWIDEGLRALGIGGPDAVRIEKLADTLGVTKGGFYWHFEDRPALLDEMLEAWERLVVDEVIVRIERDGGDARDKLGRLFTLGSSSRELMKVELAVREWARRDKRVAKRLKRVDNRRMDYMRSLFGEFCADDDDVEVRCTVAFCMFIGNHFIVADDGPRRRGDVLKLALSRLLE